MQPPNVRARRRVPHHAKLYYKVVAARDDGSFRSIYDGTTNYAVGEVTTGPPLYACHSIGAVVVHGRHRLSDECAMLDAPRAILRCWGWRLDGSLPAPVGTPGKYRLDALLPIAALPWSSTGGHDGIPPYSELRPPARGVASAVVCGPAALRRGGARWSSHVSEQLQAATVRLHEDVLRMSGALEGLDLLRAEALGAARRPSEPRPAWVERALAAERSAAAASSGA